MAAERKLLFFLSWANEQPPEAYELLALAAAGEHHKHAAILQEDSGSAQVAQRQHETASKAGSAAWTVVAPEAAAGQPRVLIEEIS